MTTELALVSVRAIQPHHDKAAGCIRETGDVYTTTHDRADERVEAGLVVLTDDQADGAGTGGGDGSGGGTGQPSPDSDTPTRQPDAPPAPVEEPAPGTLEPGAPVETEAPAPEPAPTVES